MSWIRKDSRTDLPSLSQVFDVPSRGHETFETRQRFLEELFPRASPDTPTSASAAQANPLSADAKEKAGDGFIRVVEQEKCDGWDHLEEKLELIKGLGGEGCVDACSPARLHDHRTD